MTDQPVRESRHRETRTDPYPDHKQSRRNECGAPERHRDDPNEPESAAREVDEDRSSPPLSLAKTFPSHRAR